MKLTHLAALLALAVPAMAAPPGSYAVVTSSLTVTDHVEAPPTVLKNGNKETKATETTYKVTNAAILAECQRQGYLTTGDIKGWKIYAVFNKNSIQGFYVSSGLQTVAIPTVIGISNELGGFTTKGKWVEDTEGELVSGGTTYRQGFLLTITIDGVSYTSTVIATITDRVIPMWPLSEPVWRPGAWNVTVNGISTHASERVMQGKLSVAAAKSTYNLSLGLLGFPDTWTFDE